MKIIGLDFETTGLSTETDRVIEIGAVLWDSDRKLPLEILSCLILHSPSDNVVIGSETEAITKIRNDDVRDHGIPTLQAFEALHKLMPLGEYIIAHNGAMFDRPIYNSEVKRLGL